MTRPDLIDNLFAAFHMLMCDHKASKTYGTNLKLSFSDMSLLQCVAQNQHAKASDISLLLGMTNGAVTQLAKKLIEKGLILPYQANQNRKEVFYELTDLGKMAYNGYHEHYLGLRTVLYQYIRGLTKEEQNKMNGLFEAMMSALSLNKNCGLVESQENCNIGRCEKCKRVY